MTNLHEILKIKNGLPAKNLHNLLYARKFTGNSGNIQKKTATGYPCILENSAGKTVIKYRIYGNENCVGNLVESGVNSGKYEIPVVCRGKNLFNNIWEQGQYVDGVWQADNLVRATGDWIKVQGGKQYTMSINDGLEIGAFINFNYFDADKQWLGNRTTLNMSVFPNDSHEITLFTLPENAEYARLTVRPYKDISGYITPQMAENLKVQFEEGETATGYEPYYEPVTTSIFLDKPLESGEILKYPENKSLPQIPTFEGTTIIETATEIPPSDMEITYRKAADS